MGLKFSYLSRSLWYTFNIHLLSKTFSLTFILSKLEVSFNLHSESTPNPRQYSIVGYTIRGSQSI